MVLEGVQCMSLPRYPVYKYTRLRFWPGAPPEVLLYRRSRVASARTRRFHRETQFRLIFFSCSQKPGLTAVLMAAPFTSFGSSAPFYYSGFLVYKVFPPCGRHGWSRPTVRPCHSDPLNTIPLEPLPSGSEMRPIKGGPVPNVPLSGSRPPATAFPI